MSDSIQRVAVLGAGTMGHGIAQVAAMAGYATCLYDLDEERVGAGRAKAEANRDSCHGCDALKEVYIEFLRIDENVLEGVDEFNWYLENAFSGSD